MESIFTQSYTEIATFSSKQTWSAITCNCNGRRYFFKIRRSRYSRRFVYSDFNFYPDALEFVRNARNDLSPLRQQSLTSQSSKHLVDRSFRRFFPTFSRLVPWPLFDINRAPTQLIPFDRPIFAWFSNFLPDLCSLEKLPGIYYFSLLEIEGSCLCQLRSNFFSLTCSLRTGNWNVPSFSARLY